MQTEKDNESITLATPITCIMQSKPVRESNKESDNHVVHIVFLTLIPLIILLIWIGFMYERLLENPFLAILLVLGILVILSGGAISFGPIRIQSRVKKQSNTRRNNQRTHRLELEQVHAPYSATKAETN